MKKINKGEMPDIASHSSSTINSKIDWVGMDEVTLPMIFAGESCLAKVNVHVNVLDPSVRGIHMSRLFLALGNNLLKKELTPKNLIQTIENLIQSQDGLSDSVRLILKWQQPLERKALLSNNTGWKTYPVSLRIQKVKNKISWVLGFSTYYSSTCPCSAALSRQLKKKAFQKQFADKKLNFDEISNWLEQNQIASPHSQRSRADIRLQFTEGQESCDVIKYLNKIEDVLKTPVQTAVKREDEQEFARLNGENLMFVEDALRRMREGLLDYKELKNFRITAHHFESLHQHNAVGTIYK